ncbi:hypothetical protein HGA13_21200 [Nocardia speluncae]|uniref:Uncharacterized protein n=1 Tax=Nocardia speluncae TaxID=419477 RepID=A0A846XHE2_9NOCA|nr:hypothetical protein [Nocardia speluncae]NKY35568.1 hypothetical protein [Nocardia speluncae]
MPTEPAPPVPPAPADPPTTASATPGGEAPRYLEVWGDTVVGRHLAFSVAIGIGVSLSALLLSNWAFSSFVTNESLADAYALLVGIAGCVVAGVICGRMFRPKRIVVTDASEDAAVGEVIAALREERQGLGSLDDLPDHTRRELDDLGLRPRFAAAERDDTGATS